MPSVNNRYVGAIDSGTTFKPWVNVKAFFNGWKDAKKVFAHDGNNWVEVWNNRPVTTTGAGSSSQYDRISVTGTVDPNNFSSTPQFFYKKSTDSNYIADIDLNPVTGDGSQSVGTRVITGLTENTTYNYYLSATNDAGTSDIPATQSVTTPYDCRTDGPSGPPLGNGWSSSVVNTTESCGTCGTRTKTVTTYTKAGCVNSPVVVTTYSSCTEQPCGCAAPNTNGWSATKTGVWPDGSGYWRLVSCGPDSAQIMQSRDYITKTGCTTVVTRDWYNNSACVGWYDYSSSIVNGQTWAGYVVNTGTYGLLGPPAVYIANSAACGISGECCGGFGIKYYRADRYFWTGWERLVEYGCYSSFCC